jgi:hypothetical protein
MARKSYKKGHSRKARRGGGDSYPAASPSSYSDSQSYMLATVGKGNVQYDNVFMSDKSNGTGNAIVGLQGQKAGKRRRPKTMKHTKKRKGGYWGQVINQAIVPFSILGLQQSYRSRKHGSTKKRRY